MTDLTAIDTHDPFNPDWASPPGDTIVDLLEERGWTQQQLADLMGYSAEQVNRLIDGKAPLREEDAIRLQNMLGGSVGFWLNREKRYRAFHVQPTTPLFNAKIGK